MKSGSFLSAFGRSAVYQKHACQSSVIHSRQCTESVLVCWCHSHSPKVNINTDASRASYIKSISGCRYLLLLSCLKGLFFNYWQRQEDIICISNPAYVCCVLKNNLGTPFSCPCVHIWHFSTTKKCHWCWKIIQFILDRKPNRFGKTNQH